MDGTSQASKTPSAGSLKSDKRPTRMLDNDQHFLLYFIAGIYFGPDLKDGSPPKSVLQRLAEKLPPYTSDQLAGSHMKMVEVERIFYYVLRKAEESLTMKMAFLHRFFQGKLPTQGQDRSACYPQFPDLFPPEFHPHSRLVNRFKIIDNISFINNPETSFLDPDDVGRFKRLTRLDDFVLDSDAARSHSPLDHIILQKGTENASNQEGNMTPQEIKSESDPVEEFGPAMVFFPKQPTEEDWEAIGAATIKGSALTGTAAMGHFGPIIGLIDIGECEESYLFRVSLPGVKKDGSEFRCEVEKDGRVMIEGVTQTGEKTVKKCSQVFQMQSQNLCPSGQFSLSFQLPGPVDPQRFCTNFGIDGILEGVVTKDSH